MGAFFPEPADGVFQRPHGESLVRGGLGQRFHGGGVIQRQQGPAVTGGEHAFFQQGLRLFRQLQKAQTVGHRGPAFADPVGQLFLRDSEMIPDLPAGPGFLHGI